MMWVGVGVALVVVLGIGAALLRRAHPRTTDNAASEPARELSEADRVRRIAPAAPMVGLEAALDGVVDGHGRTLRDQLDAGTGVEQLRVHDDTSPILRRALDQVAPTPASDSIDGALEDPSTPAE